MLPWYGRALDADWPSKYATRDRRSINFSVTFACLRGNVVRFADLRSWVTMRGRPSFQPSIDGPMPNPLYSSEMADEPSSDAADKVLTVAELTAQVKECLQVQFSSVWVVGEISDLARPQSGHVYLTLKDNDSQIRAVIRRDRAKDQVSPRRWLRGACPR